MWRVNNNSLISINLLRITRISPVGEGHTHDLRLCPAFPKTFPMNVGDFLSNFISVHVSFHYYLVDARHSNHDRYLLIDHYVIPSHFLMNLHSQIRQAANNLVVKPGLIILRRFFFIFSCLFKVRDVTIAIVVCLSAITNCFLLNLGYQAIRLFYTTLVL